MKYISLFSGIEAATVAWENLGWECIAVSEIDPFPCEVIKYHYPNIPNLGSVTNITKEQIDELKQKHGSIDIVVGGSPCQSFSVAGKRLGLQDPRGNLMFEYCRIVKTVRPKYFIWENVPGALSSNGGQDFNCLLEEMVNIGYLSIGWRVLDAQYFGVPQRRRRVFLVGCLTDRNGASNVLFEQESRRRYLATSRKTWQNNTSKTQTSLGEYDWNYNLDCNISGTLQARDYKGPSADDFSKNAQKMIPEIMLKNNRSDGNLLINPKKSYCLTAAMGDGGGHVPMIVQKLHESRKQRCGYDEKEVCPTLEKASTKSGDTMPVILDQNREYYENHQTDGRIKGPKDLANTITARYGTGGGNAPIILEQSAWNITFNDANGRQKDRPPCGLYINQVDKANSITTSGVETKVCDVYNYTIEQNDTAYALTTGSGFVNASGPKLIETPIDGPIGCLDTIGPSKLSVQWANSNQQIIEVTNGTGLIVCLTASDHKGISNTYVETNKCIAENVIPIAHKSRVRRLTPIECERLQGFPDNYTQIPWKGKEEKDCPISPRYKALGNSMAVPVMKFLGIGIMEAEGLEIPIQWIDTKKPYFISEIV